MATDDELLQVVAGLDRRVRLLEEGNAADTTVSVSGLPGGRGPLLAQLEDWKAWAKRNALALIYTVLGVIDLGAAIAMRDWRIAVGAVALLVFAWLAVDDGAAL